MFKQAFKIYKKKTPASDLQDVIDFDLFEEKNSSSSWCNVSTCTHVYSSQDRKTDEMNMYVQLCMRIHTNVHCTFPTIVGETCEYL